MLPVAYEVRQITIFLQILLFVFQHTLLYINLQPNITLQPKKTNVHLHKKKCYKEKHTHLEITMPQMPLFI